MGGKAGEVKARETTTFIEFFKCAVVKEVTSIPDVTSILVYGS